MTVVPFKIHTYVYIYMYILLKRSYSFELLFPFEIPMLPTDLIVDLFGNL